MQIQNCLRKCTHITLHKRKNYSHTQWKHFNYASNHSSASKSTIQWRPLSVWRELLPVLILLDLFEIFNTFNIFLSAISSIVITALGCVESNLTDLSRFCGGKRCLSHCSQRGTSGIYTSPPTFLNVHNMTRTSHPAHEFSYLCYTDYKHLNILFQPEDCKVATWIARTPPVLNQVKTDLFASPPSSAIHHNIDTGIQVWPVLGRRVWRKSDLQI